MKIRLQHLRLERPLISLDTETTGLDPNTSRVVEVAAIRLDPMSKPTSFQRLINPGIPIPHSATLVHGIVDADGRGKPRFEEIAQERLRGARPFRNMHPTHRRSPVRAGLGPVFE